MQTSLHSGRFWGLVIVALVAGAQNHGVSGFTPQQTGIRHVHPSSLRKGPQFSRKETAIRQLALENAWAEITQSLPPLPSPQLENVAEQVATILSTSLHEEEFLAKAAESMFLSLASAFLTLPLSSEIAVLAVPAIALTGIALFSLSFPKDNFREGYEPYRRGEYDPLVARVYYSKHKLLIVQRSLQLLRISNKFIINYLADKYIWKDEEGRRPERAQDLLALIQKAGPTAIKVGQALSVRPDLIPSEYAEALATLQDRVPPFEGQQAKEILRKELGPQRYAQLKDSLSFKNGPVASASIGQVYRGFIGEKEVAVKVQRPNGLSDIALDLYIVREFAPTYQKLTGAATDFQNLANEWGRGFIAELDYRTEAANTMSFNEEMQKRNLNAVTAPIVVEDFVTDQVLVTEWVQGQRLDQSGAADVPRLCSVALNAYLVMLLELQSLHCDPHPGNLLRTDDGRLCILDFGMTLETDPTLQYSLLEFVAHLTGEAYNEVPTDLVKLGFLKQERLDTVRASGFLEPLTFMLKQAGQGGGATKVRERIFDEFRERYPGMPDEELRVQMRADMKRQIEKARKEESAVSGITMEVEELQKRNRDAFTIPPWFVYTSRAFLTLEGVSLQVDEDFSIIQSCFPYVARRLVYDDSPRAQEALKELLYGAGDAIDAARLTDLADGFSTYTTTTKTVNQQATAALATTDKAPGGSSNGAPSTIQKDSQKNRSILIETEATITLAKDSADILLAPEGNLVQNLLVTESALAASALVKDTLQDSLVDTPKRVRESLPFGFGNFLPQSPLEQGVAPFLKKTSEEKKAQNLIGKVSTMIPQSALPGLPNNSRDVKKHDSSDVAGSISLSSLTDSLNDVDPEEAALLAKELRESLPKYAPLVGQLGGKFASSLLKTASKNIDTTLTEIETTGEDLDQLTKVAAQSMSSVATQGADAILSRSQAGRKQ